MAKRMPIANIKGESAYDIAVANGYNGTKQDWLDSLGENLVVSDDIRRIVKLTQAEYDLIPLPRPDNVSYFVTP